MSDATDKLARTRQAILEHVARRERRHDPREETAQGFAEAGSPPYDDDDIPDPGEGWFGHMKHAVRTWWRYHPAHMAVELVTPFARNYARRKPVQLLGISLAAGAVLTFARPWKLISIGTILVAVLKSGQLSHLITAAMSASDYRKDHNRPE
ncbi:MAG: hypothetical protein K0R89_848 [Ramlibacter sp.]|jgi:hypothetical protein|nr:hypothetical protein [Ramlibacter sp.]